MRPNIRNKLISIAVLIAIIIVAGSIYYSYYLKYKQKEKEQIVSLPPAPKVEVKHLEVEKIPEVFPKDIIQEKNVQILDSYEIEIAGGGKQYSIRYLSAQDRSLNLDTYLRYFLKNNWILIPDTFLNNNEVSKFSLLKDKNMISALFYANKFTKQNIVDITLIKTNE